jgi:RNA polymerase sigma-70 factor (ECF subfamily)
MQGFCELLFLGARLIVSAEGSKQVAGNKMHDVTGERNGQLPGTSCEEVPLGRAEGVERPNLGDLEGIYRRYGKRVYSLCLRMTGDEAEAEDLTQEAFLHLFRKLDTFRGDSSFYTWFYRLAVNVVLMQFRKRRRLMETSLEEITDPDSHGPVRPPEIPAPDTRLLGTIDRVSLQEALKQLSAGFRAVFVLHDIEGYEHREIAEMLACSVGNSKSQLHRARLQLRKLLTENSWRRAPARRLPTGGLLTARSSMRAEALVAAGIM